VSIAGGIAGPNMVRCRIPVPAANRKYSLFAASREPRFDQREYPYHL
jgi:hypothetical protein